MSAWAEVDALKDRLQEDARRRKAEFRSLRQKELGNRIVFAVSREWRFTAHRNGVDVVAYRADKRVSSMGGLRTKRKKRIEQLEVLGEAAWLDIPASLVLVALDAWREVGCPRRNPKRLEAVT